MSTLMKLIKSSRTRRGRVAAGGFSIDIKK
jgi:hypothetical protein